MIKYLSELAALVIFCSLIPLWEIVSLNNFFKISLTILFAIIYLYILFRKGKESSGNKRLRKLKRGIRLVQLSSGAIAVEAALLIAFFIKGLQSGVVHAVFSVAMPVLALGIVMLDGVIRIALTSRQIKITNLIMMIFFWWLPIVNI